MEGGVQDTNSERADEMEGEALLRDARIAELVREVEVLKGAMQHSSVIEQAKGVLMHSMQCGPDAAFAVLVAASQRENVKLRVVAARIAAAQDVAAQSAATPDAPTQDGDA
ncbi:MAG: ANTAR domain-containing protein [Acidimicrobiales bacterium]